LIYSEIPLLCRSSKLRLCPLPIGFHPHALPGLLTLRIEPTSLLTSLKGRLSLIEPGRPGCLRRLLRSHGGGLLSHLVAKRLTRLARLLGELACGGPPYLTQRCTSRGLVRLSCLLLFFRKICLIGTRNISEPIPHVLKKSHIICSYPRIQPCSRSG
jgi:hypothetical protein